jgi:putative FmdB family regulatory protein
MPNYNFKCTECDHLFEGWQKMTAEPPKCEKCGKKSERLITGGLGVIFKGAGFYENDYRKKK